MSIKPHINIRLTLFYAKIFGITLLHVVSLWWNRQKGTMTKVKNVLRLALMWTILIIVLIIRAIWKIYKSVLYIAMLELGDAQREIRSVGGKLFNIKKR